MSLASIIVTFFSAFVVAITGESIIEFLLSPIVDLFLPVNGWMTEGQQYKNTRLRVVVFNWASSLLGIGICIAFSIGIYTMLGFNVGYFGIVDNILSGIICGRGSNYVHQKFFKTIAEALQERFGAA
jgi:hypothetical protein